MLSVTAPEAVFSLARARSGLGARKLLSFGFHANGAAALMGALKTAALQPKLNPLHLELYACFRTNMCSCFCLVAAPRKRSDLLSGSRFDMHRLGDGGGQPQIQTTRNLLVCVSV